MAIALLGHHVLPWGYSLGLLETSSLRTSISLSLVEGRDWPWHRLQIPSVPIAPPRLYLSRPLHPTIVAMGAIGKRPLDPAKAPENLACPRGPTVFL